MATTEQARRTLPRQKLLRVLCAFAVGVAGAAALAATPDEARLLAALKKAHPGTQFSQVTRSPVDGVYNLGIHYYCAHGVTGPTRATVRVYCNGSLAREFQQDFNQSRQFWDVATIAWPSCAVTQDPRPLRTVTQGCSN